MYVFALAWRYARARLVNYVAVLAVALALTVQIVTMAVLDGTLENMRRRVRDLGEQITLQFRDGLMSGADAEAIKAALVDPQDGVPGVIGVTPLVRGWVVLENRYQFAPVQATGIHLQRELRFSGLASHLQDVQLRPESATWAPPAGESRLPGLFLGEYVAQSLGVQAGDDVDLLYVRKSHKQGQAIEEKRRRFVVASLYRSGDAFKDQAGAYIPVAEARSIFLSDQAAQADPVAVLSVWLRNPNEADRLEAAVRRRAAEAIDVPEDRLVSYTWQQKWENMNQGMQHENNLQELILLLMNLSGGFCVFAILATLVSRRVRDVGLLRCIGAGRLSMAAAFLLVGLIIGLAGTVLGVLGGYAFGMHGLFSHWIGDRALVDYLFERVSGTPLYPPYMYGMHLVTVIRVWKVALYAGGAVLISVLAAAYPAYFASRREPVEALRDE